MSPPLPVKALDDKPQVPTAKDVQSAGRKTIPGLVKRGRPATTLITLRFPCKEATPSTGLLGGMPPKKRPLTRADTILKNSEKVRAQVPEPQLDADSDTASEKARSWLRKAPDNAEPVRGKLISTICIQSVDVHVSFSTNSISELALFFIDP